MAVFTLCLGVLLDFAIILVPFSRTYKAFIEQARYLEEKNYHPGSGQNARGAYSALQSEEMMGFDVIAFLIRMRQMLK